MGKLKDISIPEAIQILAQFMQIQVHKCHLARQCTENKIRGAYKLGGTGQWMIPLSTILRYKRLRKNKRKRNSKHEGI